MLKALLMIHLLLKDRDPILLREVLNLQIAMIYLFSLQTKEEKGGRGRCNYTSHDYSPSGSFLT